MYISTHCWQASLCRFIHIKLSSQLSPVLLFPATVRHLNIDLMWLFTQGRPTGQRTTSPRQLVWAWWWTRPAPRLKKAKRLCRVKQRSSSSQTGCLSLPARSLLMMWMSALMAPTEGLFSKTLHYTCVLCLVLSLELYFTYLESACCSAWMNTVNLLLISDLLTFFFFFLYIVAFLYLVSKWAIFFTLLLTGVLHRFRRKGAWFVQFILCLEHFVYFPGAKL